MTSENVRLGNQEDELHICQLEPLICVNKSQQHHPSSQSHHYLYNKKERLLACISLLPKNRQLFLKLFFVVYNPVPYILL